MVTHDTGIAGRHNGKSTGTDGSMALPVHEQHSSAAFPGKPDQLQLPGGEEPHEEA